MITTTTPVIEKHEVRLHTGVRLRYADVGPRHGEPLILLHGFSDSSLSFHPVLGLLPPDLRLIIPDQRGHGESECPPHGYTANEFAMDAIALLDAVAVRSAAVVGHSFGSFVAQRMAVLAPDRVNKLVLVGSAATSYNRKLVDLARTISFLRDPVDAVFVREFQASCLYRRVPEIVIDQAVRESMKLSAHVWKSVIEGLVETPFTAESAIRCPASLFWGDKDRIFNRGDQEDLLRRIQGASLHVFHDVGHTPHWEVPRDFANELISVLQL